MYGIVKARPPKIANGVIDSPSCQDFVRPKKRVIITTMKSGMRIPMIPCVTAA
jgi:hypothetical protein